MTDQRVALITGATGLLGRQLIKAFDQAGWNVVGTGFSRSNPPSILKVDLTDQIAVNDVLDHTQYALSPQYVYSTSLQFSRFQTMIPRSANAVHYQGRRL